METLVLVIHVVLSVVLIALILLQQGKGADAGASFGAGASQTVFGGRGSTSFLVKITATIAVILLVTSISLDVMTKHKANNMGNAGIPSSPVTSQQLPASSTSNQSKAANTTKPSSDVPSIRQENQSLGKSDAPTINTSSGTTKK